MSADQQFKGIAIISLHILNFKLHIIDKKKTIKEKAENKHLGKKKKN